MSLVIVGDQAFTSEEYAAYRRRLERENARRRKRRATDPQYRTRVGAYMKAWKARNQDRMRSYRVRSMNADQLADAISRTEARLTLLLAERQRRRRP